MCLDYDSAKMAGLICTKETCGDKIICSICQKRGCARTCEEEKDVPKKSQGRDIKRCKKCGNKIKKTLTLEEQGICTPETCGTQLACGDNCCKRAGRF
jgi:hypothetical protein